MRLSCHSMSLGWVTPATLIHMPALSNFVVVWYQHPRKQLQSSTGLHIVGWPVQCKVSAPRSATSTNLLFVIHTHFLPNNQLESGILLVLRHVFTEPITTASELIQPMKSPRNTKISTISVTQPWNLLVLIKITAQSNEILPANHIIPQEYKRAWRDYSSSICSYKYRIQIEICGVIFVFGVFVLL